MIKKFTLLAVNQFKIGLGIAAIVATGFLSTSGMSVAQAEEVNFTNLQTNIVQSDISFQDKTYSKMSYSEKKILKNAILDKVNKTVSDYKNLGLYENVKNHDFIIEIGSSSGDKAYYEEQTILLNFSKSSSLNEILLNENEFKIQGFTEKQNNAYDLEKTLTHEMGHLEYTKNSNLSTHDIINKFINSDILLSSNEKSINTSYQYVQENFADVYGELAYLKKNGFSNENIEHLKEDIKTRINEQIELKKSHPEYGENFDSHDTAKSLNTLLTILKDDKLRGFVANMSVQNYAVLAKGIVFNNYVDYVMSPEVKAVIEKNLSNSKENNKEELINSFKELSSNQTPKVDLIKLINSNVDFKKSDILNNIKNLRNKESSNINKNFKVQ